MLNPNQHFMRKAPRERRVGVLSGLRLQALDQRKIAVHFVIGGRERVVHGKGTYGLDAKLGGVLRIDCADANGGFEVLIRDSEWNGDIQPGVAFGCDYVVRHSLPK